MLHQCFVEENKTIFLNKTFFENLDVYEITFKKYGKFGLATRGSTLRLRVYAC